MNAESAPPKGAPQTFACQRDHLEVTRDLLGSKVDDAGRDGDGGFRVGDTVRTYSGRSGIVAEVRRVVPKEIADALHTVGRTTCNGDFEIGVDFSNETIIDNLRASAFFLPRELAPKEAVQRRSASPSGPAGTSVAVSTP